MFKNLSLWRRSLHHQPLDRHNPHLCQQCDGLCASVHHQRWDANADGQAIHRRTWHCGQLQEPYYDVFEGHPGANRHVFARWVPLVSHRRCWPRAHWPTTLMFWAEPCGLSKARWHPCGGLEFVDLPTGGGRFPVFGGAWICSNCWW